MQDIIFPELSYSLIGANFKVYNELGWGYTEVQYQKALAKELDSVGIKYKREFYIPLKYQDKHISKFFADFVAEEKILLELKVVHKLGYSHTKQIFPYLVAAGIRLGILVYFTKDGVKYRRVLNPHI